MSRARVLCALAACAVATPVVVGQTTPARGALVAADKGKDKDKSDDGNKGKGGKGSDDPAPPPAPAPAPPAPAPPAPSSAPAPAPAPAPVDDKGDNKGKGKDNGKSPKNGATTVAPGSTTAPGTTVAPAAPGASAAPVVAIDTPAAAPRVGRSVGVAATDGTVLVRTADGRPLHPLDAAAAIPTGARVDARAGTVELTSVVDADGMTQTASFTGAIFQVHQDRATGLTRIRLAGGDFSGCRGVRRAATATTARKRKPVRSLWGKDDHGRFQTSGKGAVGTVRGTRWLTEDFCDGTRVTVAEGTVSVRDRRTGQIHTVRAGYSFFAKYAPRRKA